MRTSELLLSSLNITEDDYSYKGHFILSSPGHSESVDVCDLEDDRKVERLKNVFGLDESVDQIRDSLKEMVMDRALIASRITEGENYEDKAKRYKL